MRTPLLPRARKRVSDGAAVLAGAAMVAATALAGVSPAASTSAGARGIAPAAASAPHDVIANLFEWNWGSVANECTTVLGPNGYGAVQVAPPEDSIRLAGSAHAWWDVYQPAAYDLNSRFGTEAQFAAMVSACHGAGVKVYADAVVNHMAGANQTSTDSYGGASFNPAAYTYANVPYDRSSFHGDPPCPNADLTISDWNSVTQVQECQLLVLSDLYTEKDDVRTKIAGYLNKLEGYGVDGFRVDAAKHIAQADMAAILGKVNNTTAGVRPYVYQEVFPGSSGQLAPSAFEGNGSVLEFTYAYKLKDQFNGSIANLRTFGGAAWGIEPSDKSAVMVTNHDLERNGSTLTYKDGATYTLATLFELAWGYGTPQVYSGFDFSSADQSPPADADGFVSNTTCGTGWECLDRATSVAGMVGWHNATAGAAVADWYDDGSNAIAFSRGSAGWVSLNNEGSPVTHTYATGLPAGTYCDVIHGTFAGGACSGPTVSVDASGTATVTTAGKDAVALDVNAVVSGPSQVSATFNATATTSSGQNVFVVGSIAALGSWDTSKAVALSSAGYPVWSGTVTLPVNTAFQYKYIKKNPDGTIEWESGANRTASTGAGGSLTLDDTWSGTSSAVSVAFNATVTTWYGQNVFVVGSIAALGSWDTSKAVALSPANYPVWSATLSLPPNTAFQYKYIKKDPDGTIEWESGANRAYTTGAGGSASLNDTWK